MLNGQKKPHSWILELLEPDTLCFSVHCGKPFIIIIFAIQYKMGYNNHNNNKKKKRIVEQSFFISPFLTSRIMVQIVKAWWWQIWFKCDTHVFDIKIKNNAINYHHSIAKMTSIKRKSKITQRPYWHCIWIWLYYFAKTKVENFVSRRTP